MEIEELYTSDSSPLDAAQRGDIEKEHQQLKECIACQRKLAQDLRDENRKVRNTCERLTREAVGCIDAVKAMLQYGVRYGATHKEKDFYASAVIAYIDELRKTLRPYFVEDGDILPF